MTPCPYCKRQPSVEQCAPWPKRLGPAPWYVGCYQSGEREHCLAVNGDTEADAIGQWETTVSEMAKFQDAAIISGEGQ